MHAVCTRMTLQRCMHTHVHMLPACRPCGPIWSRAAEAGLLLSVTADSVIRLVPPLIMTEAEADEVVAILVPLITTFLAETA